MSKRTRAHLSRALLSTAAALLVVPFVANPILLAAGNFRVANPERPGASLIGLESLSMVSFHGIIPSNETHPSYLVKLSYFPNAFTWSWPSAPTGDTSGILLSGPAGSLDPFALVETIPGTPNVLPEVPPEEYQCLKSHYYPPDRDMQCSNPFWTAVLRNRIFSFTIPFGWLPMLLHTSAAVVLLLMWASEWMIAKKKWWMRCQCPGFFQRFCPLPKVSSKDEIEALSEHDWDKVRVYLYWTAVAYCVLPVVHGSLIGAMFVRSLGSFDSDLPKGMSVDAQLGGRYLGLMCGSAACAVVSALCVTVRWRLGRPRGWIDQQEIGTLDALDGETDGEYRDGTTYGNVNQALPSARR